MEIEYATHHTHDIRCCHCMATVLLLEAGAIACQMKIDKHRFTDTLPTVAICIRTDTPPQKRALSTTAVGSAEKDKKHKRTGNTLSRWVASACMCSCVNWQYYILREWEF